MKIERKVLPTWRLQRLEFTENLLVETLTYYDRDDCGVSGEATSSYSWTKKISLGLASDVVKKARVFVETEQNSVLTALSNSFAVYANSRSLHDFTNWQVGTTRSYSDAVGQPKSRIFQIIDSRICFEQLTKKEGGGNEIVGINTEYCFAPASK